MSEPRFQRTLVLADEVDPALLHAVAAREGWVAYHAKTAGYSEKAQVSWDVDPAVEDGTTVVYFEEHYAGYRLVTAAGGDESEVAAIAAVLAAALPSRSEDALLSSLLDDSDPGPRETVRDLRALASFHYLVHLLGARVDPLDPRYPVVFERHVAHPHRQVRLTAMLIADQLSHLWPELREPVIARKGVEVELDHIVDAFVQAAAEAG